MELECRVRMEQLGAHENNTLVFGKINTLIKIIQQQWNLEYSQTHNVFGNMCLSLSRRVFSENNESQRGDSFSEWQKKEQGGEGEKFLN